MCSRDWETGSQPASQPAEAKKDQRGPCVADVFHKPSSQLGHSCPNRRPWEKTGRVRGGGGRRLGGSSGESGELGKGQTG